MMRLFIGIPLPRDYQQQLAAVSKKWQKRFKSKLSWTKPGNWHLTLKFLGDVHIEKRLELERYMHDLSWEVFSVAGSKAGFFGSKGVYRVAWVGLDGDLERLADLARRIDADLAAMGFSREKRPFKAHLTLARIKGFHRDDPWNELASDAGNRHWPCFKVREAVLWESILKSAGPVYRPLSRIYLS